MTQELNDIFFLFYQQTEVFTANIYHLKMIFLFFFYINWLEINMNSRAIGKKKVKGMAENFDINHHVQMGVSGLYFVAYYKEKN